MMQSARIIRNKINKGELQDDWKSMLWMQQSYHEMEKQKDVL